MIRSSARPFHPIGYRACFYLFAFSGLCVAACVVLDRWNPPPAIRRFRTVHNGGVRGDAGSPSRNRLHLGRVLGCGRAGRLYLGRNESQRRGCNACLLQARILGTEDDGRGNRASERHSLRGRRAEVRHPFFRRSPYGKGRGAALRDEARRGSPGGSDARWQARRCRDLEFVTRGIL